MGTDYTAISAIGAMVPREAIWKKGKVRGCEHPLADPAARYCAACGKLAWRESSEPRQGYDECKETLCGFKVASVTGMEPSRRLVVCVSGGWFRADEYSGPRMADLDPGLLAARKQELRAMFESEGIAWDEAAFGLWTILYAG